MRPLFSLHQDHELLLPLSEALDLFARALASSEAAVDPGDLAEFACAFRGFADQLHYEKEEHVLLPFIVRHGFDWNGELLEAVRADHSRDRYLIDVLHQAGQRKGGFSWDDRRRLAATASTLAGVQRGLAMKQEIELFPEISVALDPDALDSLDAELSAFDRHNENSTTELRPLISRLMARYGAQSSVQMQLAPRYGA
jgi:hemerythrin-like domain-containing protein